MATIELNSIAFWIQIHDIPVGFESERICKDVGNFTGGYELSDPRNFDGNPRMFLKVGAQVLLFKPLKRIMKMRNVGAGLMTTLSMKSFQPSASFVVFWGMAKPSVLSDTITMRWKESMVLGFGLQGEVILPFYRTSG